MSSIPYMISTCGKKTRHRTENARFVILCNERRSGKNHDEGNMMNQGEEGTRPNNDEDNSQSSEGVPRKKFAGPVVTERDGQH
uniref:Uncharacterized protein n=1 Tax=Strongyloides venezuelensis TaxID=75913 RepID=A0A0K0F055_STRVS